MQNIELEILLKCILWEGRIAVENYNWKNENKRISAIYTELCLVSSE